MSYLNCIEVKLKVAADGINTRKHDGRAQVVQSALKGESINITYKSKALFKMLESVGCEVRDGITGGCYGARDGSSYEGFTVWVDASQMPERSIIKDDDGRDRDVVNILALIESYNGELIEDLDGDIFEEACENLGLSVSKNNTYNYAGQDSESPYFLVDADYAIISNENSTCQQNNTCYLSIKFHCGGNIRGNYTERVVFKFDSLDDIYSVIYPIDEQTYRNEA